MLFRRAPTRRSAGVAIAVASVLAGCATADKSDEQYREDVVASIHDSINSDLLDLVSALHNLQANAPTVAWREAPASIALMQEDWTRARTAWEHVEGAVTALVSGVDMELDARYEDLAPMASKDGDQNPFDDVGFIGMHAVERILFSRTIREEVITFESKLNGYKPAAYPANDDEAVLFKFVLVQALIDAAEHLDKNWQPAMIDVGAAYQGLVGLMNEQTEKVVLAVNHQEESRYANITLFDLQHNVEGTQKVFGLFREWIHSRPAGSKSDIAVKQKLEALADLYKANGDSLPAAPQDWADDPTPANLATPFGAFWKTVHDSVDPASHGSVVFEMNQVAGLLGLPKFVDEAPSSSSKLPPPPRSVPPYAQ